jgi:hypothetical protein
MAFSGQFLVAIFQRRNNLLDRLRRSWMKARIGLPPHRVSKGVHLLTHMGSIIAA